MSASFEQVFSLSFFVSGLVMTLWLLAWTLWKGGVNSTVHIKT
jgi:hypothetical protein